MKRYKSITLTVFGLTILIFGVVGIRVFSRFGIGPGLSVTVWRDVIIFSVIALCGLGMFFLGVRQLLRRQPKTRCNGSTENGQMGD